MNIVFRGGFFDKILMTGCKRIGVHNQCRNASSIFFLRRKFLKIAGESGFAVFHENDLFINARNLIKTKIAEKLGRAAFGIEKQMCICTFKLYFHEVGHNLVHETFSLMDTAHCHAAQGIAEAASGCNGI